MKYTLKKDQVRNEILYRILSGQYLVSGRIPPERELCESMQVSRITVRAAVDELEQEGFLRRDGRRGTLIEKMPTREDGIVCSGSTKQILFIYFSSVRGHMVSRTGTSSRLYHGVERFANEHDYVLRVQSGENFMRQTTAGLVDIDGIIAGGSCLEEHLPLFIESGIPTVVVDSIPHRLMVDAVCADYYEAGMLAAGKCLTKGLHKPLFLQLRFGDENFIQPNLLMRQRGFFDALEGQAGITADCHIVNYDDLTTGGGAVKKLLSVLQEKASDAIVYCADIPYRFLLKQPELSALPSIVIGGKPEELQALSDNMPEVISFNMEYIGCLATMRLHERMQNPRLGIIRQFIPAGDAFGLDSETDAQSV